MAKPITPHLVRQMDNIVTTYDAHKLMADGIRTSSAGCKPREYTEQQCRLFLVSALLTVHHDPTLTIRRLHETLTQGLSNTSQLELDVLTLICGELELNIAPTALRWISRRIRERLNWTPAMVPDLTMDERLRRKATVLDIANALIRSTLDVVNLDEIKFVSIDSSAIESFSRKSRRFYASGVPLPDSAYAELDSSTAAVIARAQGHSAEEIRRLSRDANATGGIPTNESLGHEPHHGLTPREVESSILRMTHAPDRDAQYSGKTPNNTETGTNKKDPHGHTKIYSGKQVNTISSVRHPTRDQRQKQDEHEARNVNPSYRPLTRIPTTNIPPLIVAVEVTGAGQAQVDPAMRNIDRTIHHGITPHLIVSDAEFSSAAAEDWADQLRARGIDQVLTLKSDQLRYTEFEGALVRGNEVYCPSHDFTQIEEKRRPKPRPLTTDAEIEKYNAAMDDFHDSRDRQLVYLAPIKKKDPDRGIQVTCPARAGKVGCPLVPGSIDAADEQGLPIIASPPAAELRGKLCNQDYLSVPVHVTGKLAQRFPYGSRDWELANNGRASPEGGYGSMKSPHTTGMRRGVHEFTGLAWDNIFAGLAAALDNYRRLNNWVAVHEPGLQHLLVAKDEHEWHGWDLHSKQTAIAKAIGANADRSYSYEFITHTCDTVADEQIVRTHIGPNGDPHGYTQHEAYTETWEDQCDKPHCVVIHTYGSVLALVDMEHERTLKDA